MACPFVQTEYKGEAGSEALVILDGGLLYVTSWVDDGLSFVRLDDAG